MITSNYTVLNFVPLFLWQQFTRFANAYFLIVCILQATPAVSITNGIPMSALPLCSVLLFDAIITAQEDYKRHVDDAADNGRTVWVMNDRKKFRKVTWSDVRVGDIIKVYRNDDIAADMVLLGSYTEGGDPEDRNSVFVQTAQLDGETNLKLRQSKDETPELVGSDEDVARFRGHVECEAPNGFFGQFTGVIHLPSKSPGGAMRSLPLEADNTLLRGCKLKNVDHAYGLVVYTGAQTKVRVKQSSKKVKVASIESIVNKNIVVLVLFLTASCLVGAVGFAIWEAEEGTLAVSYLGEEGSDFVDVVLKLFTFFLLNSAFIPVSLYVSMKMARTFQKVFMEADIEVYHEDPDVMERSEGTEGQYPLKVRTMELNDELGQISHIFSDKTGTFTLNYMEFRKLSVRGVSYGLGTTLIGIDRMKRMGEDTTIVEEVMERTENSKRPLPHVMFEDGSESHGGESQKERTFAGDREAGGDQATDIEHMLLHMVLNHSVVPEVLRDHAGNPTGKTALSASSPDEEAFVYAAEFFGVKFVDRQSDAVTLEINGERQTYKTLHYLAYNQHRKRMGLVCEHPDGEIYVYVKGADNVIFARLAGEGKANDADATALDNTNSQLATWGNDGLRTLCFGYKKMSREEYEDWASRYDEACGKLEEQKKRKAHESNLIDDLMEEAESGLTLQGATANEDKLQPQVPETIELMGRAGINVWMLTGDKRETAVNIGYATRMLNDSMEQLFFTTDEFPFSKKGVTPVVDSSEKLKEELKRRATDLKHKPAHLRDRELALVIDEAIIDRVLEHDSDALLSIARNCKAVICCRARPDQKAAMVSLIRNGVPGVKTLAIGDGANDVDMIQTAHVGVGIIGPEGVQAANAADYAVGRFRFLARLLLVHGRDNYRRMSKLIAYMFYKNICMVFAQFLYSIYTGWTGQKFYIEFAVQTFNLVYTGAPIVVLALFDRDVSPETALRFPKLYADGPSGKRLSTMVFWGWVAAALVEAVMVLLFSIWAMERSDVDGASLSVFQLGSLVFFGVTLITSLRITFEVHLQSPLFQVIMFLSVIALPVLFAFFDLIDADGMKGGVVGLWEAPAFWWALPLLVALPSARTVMWKSCRRYFHTELRHVVQEAELVESAKPKLEAIDSWCAQANADPRKERTLAEDASFRSGKGAGAGEAKADGGGDDEGVQVAPADIVIDLDGGAAAEAKGSMSKSQSRWHSAVKHVVAANRFRLKHTGSAYSVDEHAADVAAHRFSSPRHTARRR